MRNTIYVALALGLMLTLTACDVTACDVTPAGRCDQAGGKHTNKNGTSYTCTKMPDDGGPGAGKTLWIED